MRLDIAAIFMTESTMAKTCGAKSNVQFIRTPDGSDLAVLPRNEYDRLVALAAEAQEDAGASRIVRNSMRHFRQDIRCGRRYQNQIGFLSQRNVRDLPVVGLIEDRRQDRSR